MKKNTILILICFLLLLACVKQNSNNVKLFNDVEFVLGEGESSDLVDSNLANEYRSYVLNPDYEFPLFKYIKHTDYQIFIALPFNMDTEKLFNLDFFTSKNIDFKNGDNYIFFKHKKKDMFVVEYLLEYNQSVFHFLCITNDEDIDNNLLSYDKLIQRISLK